MSDSIYTILCNTHGALTAVFTDLSLTGLVDGCRGCDAGLDRALKAARFAEVVAAVRADIEFGNTDPGWIGERPGVVSEEEILAAAREQIAFEDAEFQRGWDQYTIDREEAMS